jgi:glycosyltransferase involved in cell wall biosynthesis
MSAPTVSIGLPVYNGARFLARAIETLLAQDHAYLELVVCDNASTDGTEAICRDFAARDERVRYYRNSTNLGAAPNFNLAVDLATAPLFKWAAHDDLHDPRFLGACVRALAAHPEAVLAYTQAVEIDDQEHVMRPCSSIYDTAASPSAVERFRLMIRDEHNCFPVFGVIRRDVLLRTPRIGPFVGSDRVLLAELALHGPFVEVPEPLFLHREHPARSTRSIPRHQRLVWFQTGLRNRVAMPHWRFIAEYIRAVLRAPLSNIERARCMFEVARWLKRYRRHLMHDLRVRFAHSAAADQDP